MQTKGLFVALCCGALCLTGCIKNIESESVTKIREATASKLLSEAELNKAQAEAAKIKANAEETIAEAQAKLIEAQAAKEAAEAALILAKKELQEIENEIMKVKLEEEREELKRKKAEVEKQIAEYEAAIAWAAVAQQAAIDMMEQMANEAELNALKHEVEMLQQKQNIVAEASKLNSDLRKRLIHVWDKYNDYSDKYYKAQAELILAQTKLARLEAGMESNYEATVEAIVEKQNEIAFLELQVATLESYITYSSEEIKEFLKEAEMTLADVKTEELAAKETEDFLEDQLKALINEEGKYVYTQVWDPLVDLANDLIEEGLFTAQVMPLGGRDVAGFAYKGEFYPLFTGKFAEPATTPATLAANTKIETEWNGVELYPESVDGKKATVWGVFPDVTILPAYISTESFEYLLADMNEVIDEDEADEIEDYYYWGGQSPTWYVDEKDEYEAKLARLEALFNEYSEYVTNASPVIIPVYTAYQAADDIWDEKAEAVYDAYNAITNYVQDHPSTLAMTAEMNALQAAVEAQEIMAGSKDVFDSAVENLIEKKSAVKLLTDAKFEADSIERRAYVNQDTLGKKIADDGAIAKAYKKAQDDVIEARKGIAKQEAEVEAKLAAYRQAVLDYIENPENDKRAAAKTALDGAEAELEVLNKALTPLLEALTKAETSFKEALEKYDVAKLAWDEAVRVKTAIGNDLEKAKTDLGAPADEEAGTPASGAYKKLANAKAVFEDARATFKEKLEALSAAHRANLDELSEDFIQLIENYIAAVNEADLADAAWYEAKANYEDALAEYPHFWNYYAQIDPEYYSKRSGADDAWWASPEIGDEPYQLYARIVWTGAKIAEVEVEIAKEVKQIEDEYDALRASLAAAQEALAIIENNEDAYFTYVATLQAAGEAYEKARKAYIDAQNVSAEVEAKYKMLRDLDLLHMGIYVDVTYDGDGNPVYVEHDITWVESVINSLKLQIAEKEAELDKLMAEAELGKLIEIDGKKVTELEAYAMLVAKIERLESEINQYLALMDAYSAEIDIIMEAIESEADVD